ncbi:DUF4954 family protein [Natronogracilivirga saccharolytica]|uniref:DUF4954 family protein n=1 Tax=Natronogracilivirga saccharolytica TaxID=2812953 RepID=A0A8J7S694_9BACT|nr:DUF4954 family protein [Natronogracilivirga saccharolytica]MBP3192733.1 DUF4954 family protein [Natronogracilivirga saccharolytica]
MTYRNLNNDELAILKSNGCLAEDWDHVLVVEGFSPDRVRNVYFSGRNKLGVFDGKIKLEEGETVQCGIYHTTLHNTVLEDNIFIASVQFLSGYRVATGSVIRNVGTIAVTGKTTFGNGTEIEVLNEAGGREVMMYDRLSAQVAFIMATCRHNEKLVKQLEKMIGAYADSKVSEQGHIGTGTEIRDCGVLRNLDVGEYAKISNARHLEEVTLVSSREAPVTVGAGVIAENVIIQSGSVVETGAVLKNCFVGQGVKIGKQFSAENSVFFANSEAFHGEAVSLFAGPYSVTHHKSTLLIAAVTSFVNIGSGTNQSNHMYKLGPLHQGVLDRGVKTGSFSYMGWPMHIGPFTAVIGKHPDSFDGSEFPFSYITEMNGRSMLTPAMNLFTVGTRRDTEKWPNRDRRMGDDKLDQVHFDLFHPYIISKVRAGLARMKELREKASKEQDMVHYKGLYIKRLLLKTCARYYEMAIRMFMGKGLMRRLNSLDLPVSQKKLLRGLQFDRDKVCDRWVDAAGMYLPEVLYTRLQENIASGAFADTAELEAAVAGLAAETDEYIWAYCAALIEEWHGVPADSWSPALLAQIIDEGAEQTVKCNNMIVHDAKKEFDIWSRIGYGLSGDADGDFAAVRGDFEGNKFVTGLKKENEEVLEEADALKKKAGLVK